MSGSQARQTEGLQQVGTGCARRRPHRLPSARLTYQASLLVTLPPLPAPLLVLVMVVLLLLVVLMLLMQLVRLLLLVMSAQLCRC